MTQYAYNFRVFEAKMAEITKKCEKEIEDFVGAVIKLVASKELEGQVNEEMGEDDPEDAESVLKENRA